MGKSNPVQSLIGLIQSSDQFPLNMAHYYEHRLLRASYSDSCAGQLDLVNEKEAMRQAGSNRPLGRVAAREKSAFVFALRSIPSSD